MVIRTASKWPPEPRGSGRPRPGLRVSQPGAGALVATSQGCRPRRGLADSARVAQPDPQEIEGVPHVSREQVEPAVPVVLPADAHLLDPVAGADRQVQDFNVEHVAVDALAAEQVARDGTAEGLEAALRVPDVPQA